MSGFDYRNVPQGALRAWQALEAAEAKAAGDSEWRRLADRVAEDMTREHMLGWLPADTLDDDGESLPGYVHDFAAEYELCQECGEVRTACECEAFRPSGEYSDDDLSEVYEYHRVTGYGGHLLEKAGETVKRLGADDVWLRTTTGQSASMDGCWRRIAEDELRDRLRRLSAWGFARGAAGRVSVSPDGSVEVVVDGQPAGLSLDAQSAFVAGSALLSWSLGMGAHAPSHPKEAALGAV